jgi:hypothetical protein
VAEMSNSFPVCHRPLELQRNLPEANGCPRKEKSKSDFNVREDGELCAEPNPSSAIRGDSRS